MIGSPQSSEPSFGDAACLVRRVASVLSLKEYLIVVG